LPRLIRERTLSSLLTHNLVGQYFGAQMARVAQFEPTAWWCAREQIGSGLREHYGHANDLPPRLLLLVRKLDRSGERPTWVADLCLLALVVAIVAASFRFHFIF
jgi:hypothetical protein